MATMTTAGTVCLYAPVSGPTNGIAITITTGRTLYDQVAANPSACPNRPAPDTCLLTEPTGVTMTGFRNAERSDSSLEATNPRSTPAGSLPPRPIGGR